MNVSFRQLRLVLALSETGSVSAAARVMHVTQPTASMQLKEVSDAVGLPLYEVVARKVYMTEIGLELARTARTIATEWEGFEQRVGHKGFVDQIDIGGRRRHYIDIVQVVSQAAHNAIAV